MHLKPWRRLDTDLKHDNQTWQDAFASFMQDNPDARYIASNAQYYHDSRAGLHKQSHEIRAQDNSDELDPPIIDDDHFVADRAIPTVDAVANILAAKTSWREELNARNVIDVAKKLNIFEDDVQN